MRTSPVQQRSLATLESVLAATEKLLNLSSPETITTRAIAEEAGVSIGTFYRLFDDKSAVIRTVVDRYLEEWTQIDPGDIPMPTSLEREVIDSVVRMFVMRSVELLDKHPGWRSLRLWHYEDTGAPVREPVFDAQIATVITFIRLFAPDAEPRTAEVIATFVCESSWPLLDRVPKGRQRAGFVDEIVFMISNYVLARLSRG